MVHRIGAAYSAAALAVICSAASVCAQAPTEIVGRVGDTTVTMADLDEAWRKNDTATRARMLQELYDTRRRALDLVIGDILIDQEAAAKGVSRDALLDAELPSRSLAVTDEDVALLYGQNQNAFGGRTLEQMGPEIRAFLEQQRPTQALHAYMNDLRDAAGNVRIELDPPRTPVSVDTAYGEDVQLVFKDYPLPNHAQAFKAAEAGHCALEQGKFWELHDTMFANQDALGVDDLKRHAGELGMDQSAFDSCLDSGRFAERVNDNLREGQEDGVSSTPTVFINGRTVMGAAPYSVFEQIIEEELARAGR
jgi:predicted DsbA family dithiol-disulfide isomerase